MRTDSSLRELRSSLIKEDADMMKVIPPAMHWGRPLQPLPVKMLPCVPRPREDSCPCRPERSSAAPHHKIVAPLWRIQTALQGAFAALVIANADRLIHAGQENLSVADLAGARRTEDGLYRLLCHWLRQHHFDLGLGNEIYAVFTATIDLGMAFLASVAAHLEDGHAFDANLVQRRLHRVQL